MMLSNSALRRLSVFSFVVALLTLVAVPTTTRAAGDWTATGTMTAARAGHSATLLPSGRVLVAGGVDNSGGATTSAELYDPVSGAWSATGRMTAPRASHTATLLLSGKVLVTSLLFGPTSSAELYDPATGTWSPTGSLTVARAFFPTATLLPSGKVLVAGGFGGVAPLASAELYDPVSGTWSATGNMHAARDGHTATLLSSGQVLVVGGRSDSCCDQSASAELYDPVSGSWTATGSLIAAHPGHTATLLLSGKVLVAGSPFGIRGSAEVYDPAIGSWSATSNTASAPPLHTATLLPSGQVLTAGGIGPSPVASSVPVATAELFDPVTNMWAATGSMSTGRRSHTATLLSTGKVLVAGGYGQFGVLTSAELYTPTPLDTTPPEIVVSTTPSANASGWNSSDVTVTWSVSDPQSGIASTTGCDPTTIAVETAGITLTCSARNGAGLVTVVDRLIKIDKSAPTISFSGNAGAYTIDQTILITCAASDSLSGIATTSCPAVAAGAATNYVGTAATTSTMLTAAAADIAGNSANANTTFSVTVTADGICRLTAALATAEDICTKATSIASAPTPIAKSGKLRAFDNFVAAQSGKSIPGPMTGLLSRLAHLL